MPDNEVAHAHQTLHHDRASTPISASDRGCALDEDGNLMDASRIIFHHSPSDERPISGPGVTPPSPTPVITSTTQRPQRHSNRSKFHNALAYDKLNSDEELGPSSQSKKPTVSNKRKKDLSDSDTDAPATQPTRRRKKKHVPKKNSNLKTGANAAVGLFLRKPEDVSTARLEADPALLPLTVTRDTTPSVSLDSPSPPSSGNNAASVSISISIKEKDEHESGADVLTVFRRVEGNEDGKNKKFECTVCAYVFPISLK